MFFEAMGNYTKLILRDLSKALIVRCSLKDMLSKLPKGVFLKTHRSYAVSIYFIDQIERDHIVVANKPIPLTKKYYKSLMTQLSILSSRGRKPNP